LRNKMKSLTKDMFNFSYENYKQLILYSKNIAPIFRLKDFNQKKGIILRHDVDFDIKSAYNLAQIEKEMGIVSTFFISTTSPTYNPRSSINRKMLSEMAQDGFEIALHFDMMYYGNASLTVLEKKVNFESKILESIIEERIESISLHNPSINGIFPIFKGYNNAYAPEIFSNDCYISDSRMTFNDKDPYTFILKAKDTPIQVLLHPEHWSPENFTYLGFYKKFLHEFAEIIDDMMQVNSTYYREIGNASLKDLIFGEKL